MVVVMDSSNALWEYHGSLHALSISPRVQEELPVLPLGRVSTLAASGRFLCPEAQEVALGLFEDV